MTKDPDLGAGSRHQAFGLGDSPERMPPAQAQFRSTHGKFADAIHVRELPTPFLAGVGRQPPGRGRKRRGNPILQAQDGIEGMAELEGPPHLVM